MIDSIESLVVFDEAWGLTEKDLWSELTSRRQDIITNLVAQLQQEIDNDEA